MIRVFPRKTKWTPNDELVFIGDPPLFRPPDQLVCISVTFTWDIDEGYRLLESWMQYYTDVNIGGPAFDDPGDEFIPGRFIKKGITITSRGCPENCPWCYVPKREGKIKELEIKPGWIIQDNNLLACSNEHIEKVFEMLKEQKRGIKFSGGLDVCRFNEWHRNLLDKININELWFSCDDNFLLPQLKRIANLISDISINKKRCYVLIGFDNELIYEAERRLNNVYKLGFLPFAQLYRGPNERRYSQAWKDLNRKWSRPAAYRR